MIDSLAEKSKDQQAANLNRYNHTENIYIIYWPQVYPFEY